MKHLKRVLSLVLVMVMLLGMMTIPTGAASDFADADRIVNTDEVAITSGMGLFAGTSDGNFDPTGAVNRAQMATIIVKMLRGNDFNADAFKGVGVNPFTDTAGFEGGWAEGYINACYQMGVVSGYGGGIFKPGNPVTTAEALTMIINALGVDAGQGDWPATIMAKAEEMKLYGSLASKPGTNDPLTRDQLAVLVYEGVCYSPSGVTGYKVPNVDIVFTDIADAIKANGGVAGITEVVGEDSLANKIYGMKLAEGFITDNQATGEETTTIGGVEYDVETGLEQIGHYVTIYYKEAYKSQSEPGQVYAILDECDVFVVEEAITNAKQYKAVFGSKNYETAKKNGLDDVVLFDNAYYQAANNGSIPTADRVSYVAGTSAPTGTYIVKDNAVVAYVAPVVEYASYVVDINKSEGSEGVLISGANANAYIPNTEGDDKINEYPAMKVGDFVIYKQVRDGYTVYRVDPYKGAVTKLSTTEINGRNVDVLTVGGSEFVAFTGVNNTKTKLDTNTGNIQFGQTYEIYITNDNRFIGFKASTDAATDEIVYLLGAVKAPSKDAYGESVIYCNARGVDLNGKEVLVPVGKVQDTNGNKQIDGGDTVLGITDVDAGFYTYEDSSDRDAKKEGLKELTPVSTKDEGGIFALKVTEEKENFYGAGDIKTGDSVPTYTKSGTGTKYLTIGGSLTQSTPLEAEVLTTIRTDVPVNTHMLVTRMPDGASNQIEVLVLLKDPSEITNGTSIYVSQAQLDDKIHTADGYEVEVYTANTGAVRSITVEDMSVLPAAGFYSIKEDHEGKCTVNPIRLNANGAASSIINGSNKDDLIRRNRGFLGTVKGSMFMSNNSGDTNGRTTIYTTAKVVDVRTEEEVAASGVARITTMNQLISMRESNAALAVILDTYGHISGSTSYADVLYITKAVLESPGFGGVVYTDTAPGASGTKNMIAVDSLARSAGDPVKVTFDICATPAKTGFYSYSVDPQGRLVLTSESPSSSLGVHNVIDSISEAGVVATSNFGSCDCGACNGAETFTFNITQSTLIYAADGSRLTLDQLRRIAEEGFATVNYHCGTDGNADVIFLYDAGLGEFVSDAGVIYVSSGTGFTQGSMTLFKGYYANTGARYAANEEKSLMFKASATVTPGTDAPGAGSFYERDTAGNLTLLTVASGKVAYHNFFLSYSGGTLTVTTDTGFLHRAEDHDGFDCTGEAAGVLTLTGVSADLPVVGLNGINTVAELQSWVEANPNKMPPLVSYYVEGGSINALYVYEFTCQLEVGDQFYLAEPLGRPGINDTTAGTADGAYIISGPWAGKQISVSYDGYRAYGYGATQGGFFHIGTLSTTEPFVVQLRLHTLGSLKQGTLMHNVFYKVENNRLFAAPTNYTGADFKFAGKLTERHDSGTAANNTCGNFCHTDAEAALGTKTGIDVSGSVVVYDMRSAEEQRAVPVTANLAGLQAAYDRNIAVYISTFDDGVAGNPRVIFITGTEQVNMGS